MKEYMEFSAKTVDEAITKALLELETSSDRLEYEVIDKGAAGFLGMFSKPAVIRVAKLTDDSDLEEEILPAEKETVKTVSDKKEEKKPERTNEEPVQKKAPEKPAAAAAAVKEETVPAGEAAEKNEEPEVKKPAESSYHDSSRNRNRDGREYNDHRDNKNGNRSYQKQGTNGGKGGRNRGYDKNGGRPEGKPRDTQPAPAEEEKPKVYVAEPEDENIRGLMKKAEEFMAGVIREMGLAAQLVTLYDEEDKTICINIEGENMGVLIGKRGQTLDSLQYLTSLVVNKGQEEYIRVKLDTENYRERRKETLENLARNIASKVRRTKKPISLEPMNPYERRIIHSTLQNDRYVTTRSEGVEPYRHVVISPKNSRYNGKK